MFLILCRILWARLDFIFTILHRASEANDIMYTNNMYSNDDVSIYSFSHDINERAIIVINSIVVLYTNNTIYCL